MTKCVCKHLQIVSDGIIILDVKIESCSDCPLYSEDDYGQYCGMIKADDICNGMTDDRCLLKDVGD